MKTVLISTSLGWNCGDDFIRDGVLALLDLRRDVRRLYWNRGWGVEDSYANSLDVNLPLTDYVIIAGTPEWVDRHERIYRWCLKNHTPIALIGVGTAGGYREEMHGALMQALADAGLFEVVITRDATARRLLRSWGLTATELCDPALFKPLRRAEPLYNIVGYRAMGLGRHQPREAHVRRSGGPSAALDKVLHDAYRDMDRPKIAVVHDNREIQAAQRLFDDVFYSSDPEEIYRMYAQCKYYVGARIHGFVPAVAHGAAAHLVYPYAKAAVAQTIVDRLDLEGCARVDISPSSNVKGDLTLVPCYTDMMETALADERARYAALFNGSPKLRDMMRC